MERERRLRQHYVSSTPPMPVTATSPPTSFNTNFFKKITELLSLRNSDVDAYDDAVTTVPVPLFIIV
jgi:hypothetical protein